MKELKGKYYNGIKSNAVRKARAKHFAKNSLKGSRDASAYKKAPGDDTPTKPSKYTIKYKKMYEKNYSDKTIRCTKCNWSWKESTTEDHDKFECHKCNSKGAEFDSIIEDNYSKADKSIKEKSKKTKIPFGILKEVYKRGVAAWRTGHRPGTGPEQWGHGRVNSFIVKGKTYKTTDKDLSDKLRKRK